MMRQLKCQYQYHPARSPSPFQMNSESRDVAMSVESTLWMVEGKRMKRRKVEKKEWEEAPDVWMKGERIFRRCEKGKKPAPTSQRSERDVWTIWGKKQGKERKKFHQPAKEASHRSNNKALLLPDFMELCHNQNRSKIFRFQVLCFQKNCIKSI